MRDGERAAVGTHQPRVGETGEQTIADGIVVERLDADAAAHRRPVRADLDQPQECGLADGPFGRIEGEVEAVGRLGDRTRDAAGCPVTGDREGRALTTQPRLDEGMGHVRERTRGSEGVAEDQFDQPGLEPEPGETRRRLDRTSKPVRGERPDEVHPLRHQRADARFEEAHVEVVRSHDHDHAVVRRDGSGQERAELGDLILGQAPVEHLLELVDDEHLAVRPLEGFAEDGQRRPGRSEHGDGLAPSAERRHHPGEDERRLARAGCTADREERGSIEPGDRGPDVVVAPEERRGVVHSERLQAAIRALGARRRGPGRGVERGILAEDPGLEIAQPGPGFDAEFIGEPLASRAERGERVSLPVAPVERGGEDRPPPFTQGGGPHEPLGCRHDRAVLAAVEPGLEQRLLGGIADPAETFGFEAGGFPGAEVHVGLAGPEAERLLERVDGPPRIGCAHQLGRSDQSFESHGVDRLRIHGEAVALSRRRHGAAADGPPDPDHRRLHLLGPGRRDVVSPDRIGEFRRGDDASAPEDERGEERAILRTERSAVGREVTEDPDLHRRILRSGRSGVNGCGVGAIPVPYRRASRPYLRSSA